MCTSTSHLKEPQYWKVIKSYTRHIRYYLYIYSKDRKQLKIFLTQIVFAITLTPDPLGGKGWRPIEIES